MVGSLYKNNRRTRKTRKQKVLNLVFDGRILISRNYDLDMELIRSIVLNLVLDGWLLIQSTKVLKKTA